MSLLQWSAGAQSTEETELFCSRSKEGSGKCLKRNVNFCRLLNLIFIYVHCIHTVFRNSKTEGGRLVEWSGLCFSVFVCFLLVINDQASSIFFEIKIISVKADNNAAFYATDEFFSINTNSIGIHVLNKKPLENVPAINSKILPHCFQLKHHNCSGCSLRTAFLGWR